MDVKKFCKVELSIEIKVENYVLGYQSLTASILSRQPQEKRPENG